MMAQQSTSQNFGSYWGIGCARTPAGALPYFISWRDMEVDSFWAHHILSEMGIGAGSLVHFTHNYSEEALLYPYYLATRHLGGTFAHGMATPYDAYRIEMFLRRFRFQAAIGIAPGTLDGLEQAGHQPAKVFAQTPVLAALPGAYERLVAMGFQPWRLIPLGPLYAFEAPDGSGARYNAGEWNLASRNGRIFLSASARRKRDNGFENLDTGINGTLGMVTTPRGREPRLFLA